MSLTTRILLILTLMLPLACRAFAQEETTAATETTATTATTTAETSTAETTATATPPREISSYEVRTQFTSLLRDHPPEVATILVLDPTLLQNEPFLAGHPSLQRYLASHPEILRNPRFYLAEFNTQQPTWSVFDEIMQMISIGAVFTLIVFTLTWLVRTLIEQKRWKQLTKTQTEVHNKILDRFGSSEEVLAYMKTPSGTKFLESTPIPLHVEKPAAKNPHTRVIWSIHLGVVIVAAALGMLLVSLRLTGESSVGMFSLGAIGFCVGAGFIASAVVSMTLSRRLGLWESDSAPAPNPADEPGLMR